MARTFKPHTSYIHAASSVPYTGMTLCDALDRSAEKFPDREAFVFVTQGRKQRFTFGQFHSDVIGLATGLVHLGLQRNDRVGIWIGSTYEWLLTQYATAYLKIVHVRFLVGYNEEYMEQLINKTNVSTLVVGMEQINILRKISPDIFNQTRNVAIDKLPTLKTIINVDRETQPGTYRFQDVRNLGDERDLQEVLKRRQTVDFDDEMHVLFTSGSTGFPKAVVVSHRGVIENVNTVGRVIRNIVKDEEISFVSMSPFAHVGADLTTIMPVVCGYKSVVPEQKSNAIALAKVIQEEKITVSFLMFHFLYDFTMQSGFYQRDFSSLKLVFTGGNLMTRSVLEKARQLLTPNLYNFFGCSEALAVTFNGNDAKFEKVGYPLDHEEVKVVDDDGTIVPLGVTGELCIRSPYVMLRYDNDEDLTKSAITASRWYRTGDLCIMEGDGCLHIVGRKKDVIVKGGQNIYPLEVERILMKHPKVNLAQVVSVPDERLVEEVCACISLKEGDNATGEEIRRFMVSSAPDFLVPKYFLFYDAFPRAPVGKILKKKLAEDAKVRLQLKNKPLTGNCIYTQ